MTIRENLGTSDLVQIYRIDVSIPICVRIKGVMPNLTSQYWLRNTNRQPTCYFRAHDGHQCYQIKIFGEIMLKLSKPHLDTSREQFYLTKKSSNLLQLSVHMFLGFVVKCSKLGEKQGWCNMTQ